MIWDLQDKCLTDNIKAKPRASDAGFFHLNLAKRSVSAPPSHPNVSYTVVGCKQTHFLAGCRKTPQIAHQPELSSQRSEGSAFLPMTTQQILRFAQDDKMTSRAA